MRFLALCQLSYTAHVGAAAGLEPTTSRSIFEVTPIYCTKYEPAIGIEPMTYTLRECRSAKLS